MLRAMFFSIDCAEKNEAFHEKDNSSDSKQIPTIGTMEETKMEHVSQHFGRSVERIDGVGEQKATEEKK